jgi:hypothetical protein
MPPNARPAAGLGGYLKQAFLLRWNLLAFLGTAAASALTPFAGVLLPLVGVAEVLYLAGLVSMPRFRAAVDARHHKASALDGLGDRAAPTPEDVRSLLLNLPRGARERFQALRARCLELRALARGISPANAEGSAAADDLRSPALDLRSSALDRMLWVFLRLLYSESALARFVRTTDPAELSAQADALRSQVTEAERESDERLLRSLRDSLVTTESRIENLRKAEQNARFVAVELDRIEQKIRALAEAPVGGQDAQAIGGQVDAAAESVREAEKAMGQLHAITGLVEEMNEPPPILDAELEEEKTR